MKRKMMTQLNVRVTRTEREQFDSYAAQFGLDRTGLANLLLYRELRVGRLASLDRGLISRSGGRRNAKITAHLPDGRLEAFVEQAERLSFKRSAAGALILLSELEDQWLQKAVDK